MSKSKVNISLIDGVGTIAPEIYGHFAEHIGGVVYDGMWVGKHSDIPNINGFRKDVVEKFRAIKPAVIRWPGGCFAEVYNWRDGVGENRPIRPSWWTFMDGRYETNEVGTHEFMEFCSLVGAKAYFAVNVTSMTPMDARDWVDYCTSPRGSTTLAKEREKNGHAEPFDIPYWGIGNENWGGGGTMTAEQYALTYRYYATVLHNVTGKSKLVAGACSVHSYSWAEAFADCIAIKAGTPVPVHAVSLHHYCSGGDALAFDEKDWDTLMESAKKMEEYIIRHREIFASHDRKDLKLYVDEWGCMHPKGSEVSKEKYLYEQQSTLRDAVVAAYNLNLFNNNCDFVKMANIAQISNCLHSLFLVNGKNFTVTPTYYVYDMFKEHQGAACCKTATKNEKLSVSASVKDDIMTLTFANLSCTEAQEAELVFEGLTKKILWATLTTLAAEDMHAHNTFENPETVKPTTQETDIEKPITIPKAGVVALTLKLA